MPTVAEYTRHKHEYPTVCNLLSDGYPLSQPTHHSAQKQNLFSKIPKRNMRRRTGRSEY